MSTGKVLIAGGAGFIGSHLCDRYLNDGYDVVCVDNFISGNRDNIVHLMGNPHFRLIEQDITQPLDELYKLDELDAILHFASPASPNPSSAVSYMAHPIETLMVNSIGTKNLLDLSVAKNCQIICASTSEVYGDPTVHPQPETYWGNVSSTGPRSCYDEGKRFMEAIAFAYHRTHNVPIKVIRIFNTFGPRMRLDDGRFTIGLVRAIVENVPFDLFGDGSSTRSFCYVDDLVDGIVKVGESDRAIGEVINLGNPGEFSLIDAIHVAEKVSGKKVMLVSKPAAPDDPHRRKPDITKAKQLIGWEPKISFEEGLAKTIKAYAR